MSMEEAVSGFICQKPNPFFRGVAMRFPKLRRESGTDAAKYLLLGFYMGGCQNYGPFLDPYYNTAPNIWATRKRTTILTTTHILLLHCIALATFGAAIPSTFCWSACPRRALGFRV